MVGWRHWAISYKLEWYFNDHPMHILYTLDHNPAYGPVLLIISYIPVTLANIDDEHSDLNWKRSKQFLVY